MNFAEKHKLLVSILEQSDKVNSFNNGDRIESDSIAHGLIDMEESFKVIINEALPALLNSKDQEAIDEILNKITQELQHIVYHINDSGYFKTVIELLE